MWPPPKCACEARDGIADALMLLLAMRDVERFASASARSIPNEAAQPIYAAINRYRDAVPLSTRARDVLEHAEDYLLGVGAHSEQVTPHDLVPITYLAPDRLILGFAGVEMDVPRARQHAAAIVSAVDAAVAHETVARISAQRLSQGGSAGTRGGGST